MTPVARAVLASLLALSTLPPLSPAPAEAQTDGWRSEIAELLQRRAAALLDGDENAYAETMSAAPPSWRRARLNAMRRIKSLPLASYSLELQDDPFDDLAAALQEPPEGDEVHLVHATERIALRGYDDEASVDDVFFTVVKRDGEWSIAGDEDVEDLGLLSARHLWDFADIRTMERDGVLVVFHDDEDVAERILEATIDAAERVHDRWPQPERARVVVLIPRSSKDLQRILAVTFDLGPFVAFASSSVDRPNGEWLLSAHRVFVQPDTFFSTSRGFQEDTLSHEVLHIATRSDASIHTPSWLEEGVAQIYGERRVPGTPELRQRVRNRTFEGRLPEDWRFSAGSTDEIHLAYEASASFVDHLRDEFGADAGRRFYLALGEESAVTFGTGRYHLDRAARSVFERPFDRIERNWVRRIEREFTS